MNQSVPLKGLRTTRLRDPLPSAFDRDTGLTITGLRSPARRLKPDQFDHAERAQVHTKIDFHVQRPQTKIPSGLTANFRVLDVALEDNGSGAINASAASGPYVFRVVNGVVQAALLDLGAFPTGIDPAVDTYDLIGRITVDGTGESGPGFTAKVP